MKRIYVLASFLLWQRYQLNTSTTDTQRLRHRRNRKVPRGTEESLSHLPVRTLRPATRSLDGSSGRRAPAAELGSGWWRDATAPTEPEARAQNRRCVCVCVLRINKEKLFFSRVFYRFKLAPNCTSRGCAIINYWNRTHHMVSHCVVLSLCLDWCETAGRKKRKKGHL